MTDPVRIDLHPDPSREPPTENVLEERGSPYHKVTVSEVGARRYLRFEHNRQSSMYVDDPFATDFEYPAYFHVAIALCPQAARTLAVGLGGGTVVKRFWRDYPGMHVDAVELDPVVIELARRWFALPEDPRVRIVEGDGRAFIEGSAETWDVVVVDAFDDGEVPPRLTTEQFHRAVRDHLTESGVLVYNVIGRLEGTGSKPFRSLHRTLANTWRRVWVFRVDEGVDAEGENLILLATDAEVDEPELLRRLASRVDGRVTVPAFDLFGDDLVRGGIRSGDVAMLSDPPR